MYGYGCFLILHCTPCNPTTRTWRQMHGWRWGSLDDPLPIPVLFTHLGASCWIIPLLDRRFKIKLLMKVCMMMSTKDLNSNLVSSILRYAVFGRCLNMNIIEVWRKYIACTFITKWVYISMVAPTVRIWSWCSFNHVLLAQEIFG